MEYNLHINEKLEKQAIAEHFAKRGTLDPNDEAAQSELTNTIIGELVMNTTFIAPVELGEATTDEQAVTFQLIQTPQGTRFFPLFTSSEDLAAWEDRKDADTVQVTFDGYAELLKNNDAMGGIAVNPFTDNLRIDRRLVLQWYERKQLIVNGYASHTITNDSRYEFYELSPYPTELSDKLCETAKSLPEVQSIWLRGIKLDGADGILAVVEVSGNHSKAFPELGNAARDYLGGLLLHIVKYDSDFGKTAVEGITPIYTK